jgi:hypothetical protein
MNISQPSVADLEQGNNGLIPLDGKLFKYKVCPESKDTSCVG